MPELVKGRMMRKKIFKECYDPFSNTWSSAGCLAHSRQYHTATLLPSGKVLVAGGGGWLWFWMNSSAELYDPSSNTWSLAGRLAKARRYHTATPLPSGKVLFAGGKGYSGPLFSASPLSPPSSNLFATNVRRGRFAGAAAGDAARGLATIAGLWLACRLTIQFGQLPNLRSDQRSIGARSDCRMEELVIRVVP